MLLKPSGLDETWIKKTFHTINSNFTMLLTTLFWTQSSRKGFPTEAAPSWISGNRTRSFRQHSLYVSLSLSLSLPGGPAQQICVTIYSLQGEVSAIPSEPQCGHNIRWDWWPVISEKPDGVWSFRQAAEIATCCSEPSTDRATRCQGTSTHWGLFLLFFVFFSNSTTYN